MDFQVYSQHLLCSAGLLEREGISPHLCHDPTWFETSLFALLANQIAHHSFTTPILNCIRAKLHRLRHAHHIQQRDTARTIAQRRRNAKRVDSTPPNGSADGECPERWPQRLPRCNDKRGRLRFKACLQGLKGSLSESGWLLFTYLLGPIYIYILWAYIYICICINLVGHKFNK